MGFKIRLQADLVVTKSDKCQGVVLIETKLKWFWMINQNLLK